MSQDSVNIKNKKAKFEYHLLDKYTAGIMLTGTEIKSIRNSKASIVEAYCVFDNGELFVRNMFINEYENASVYNHRTRRDRKLLLNRVELNKLDKKMKIKGFSIVPTNLFIDENGRAKLVIYLAQGKKLHDKREDLKEKDTKRDIDRVMKKR
jgi:SsrA-binding protein